MTERRDVVIAGGGIIGLALAWELTRRGRHVLVLEASEGSADAAARVAAGMLAPVSEVDLAHPDLTRLSIASAEMYADWAYDLEAASGLDVAYETTGTLIVALHRDHLAEIEHLRAFQHDRGLAAETLTRGELRDAEPALAPSVVGGIRVPDRQIDPRRVLAALRAALARAGAEVCDGARVQRIESGLVTYELDGHTTQVEAMQVVIASGAWSGAIEADVALPMRPVKGLVLRLRGERLLQHVVRTPDVYLVPRAYGELVVGATMEERGFDRTQRAGDVYDLLLEATRALPGVRELELSEVCVGFRPALRDHLPAIGEVAPGVFVATGHFRDGVLLTPVTARLLSAVMCGDAPDPLLAPYAPSRFAAVEVTR
ncbi:MAG: glycine oxidase ThiO [Chloroflexi bacterium]|nr:MAG: glycine oxidase ThiO [Chloroflexota bacterium]